MVKLSAPRVVVVIEEKDGTLKEYTVQTDNRDFIQWDITRAKNSWPDFQSAQFLWLTFMAFSALHRSGAITVSRFEDFRNICLEVKGVDKDGGELNEENVEEESLVGGTLPVPDFA